MKKIFTFAALGAIATAVAFSSCKKKDDGGSNNSSDNFDRKAMLTNWGNNLIVPAYKNLNDAANSMDAAANAFSQNPDANGLMTLQTAYLNTYKAWENASAFDLGPADDGYLSLAMNTFPTDTGIISSNITAGTYNLSAASNIAAQGLPALDFLLYGKANNNDVLQLFTTDSKAANRKAYLTALTGLVRSKVNAVYTAWSTGGYLNTFINASGTDVGSSLGLLINGSIEDYEVLKNNKLGIPLGKMSMGTIYPEKVEAFYSKNSVMLALMQLQNMQNLYLGKSDAGDGPGLDDYLVQLNAQYNGGSLNDAIKAQFTVAITKLQAVAEPLSGNIQTNPADANAAYTEIQKLLVLLKTDMTSALGVAITFGDNDGD